MVERTIAQLLSFSRWLLAPFYIALVVTVAALLVKAGQHLFTFLSHMISDSETALIVGALKLVDLTLTASLVILIIFSGYSNFVATMDVGEHSRGRCG